nr:ArsR family transcriptional regulator [Desulfobacter hydrogenophilus]
MPLLIIDYLEQGPSTSKEIQAATGLSQATIARRIRNMKDRIIAVPEGRTVKYAAMRNAFNSGNNIPLSIYY